MFRFRLDEDFKYEDRRYTLFGDGPCGNYTSKYSVGVNPMKREVHADITLRNRGVVNLVLTGVVSLHHREGYHTQSHQK